jgi:hypothetical protein
VDSRSLDSPHPRLNRDHLPLIENVAKKGKKHFLSRKTQNIFSAQKCPSPEREGVLKIFEKLLGCPKFPNLGTTFDHVCPRPNLQLTRDGGDRLHLIQAVRRAELPLRSESLRLIAAEIHADQRETPSAHFEDAKTRAIITSTTSPQSSLAVGMRIRNSMFSKRLSRLVQPHLFRTQNISITENEQQFQERYLVLLRILCNRRPPRLMEAKMGKSIS